MIKHFSDSPAEVWIQVLHISVANSTTSSGLQIGLKRLLALRASIPWKIQVLTETCKSWLVNEVKMAQAQVVLNGWDIDSGKVVALR